MRHDEAGHECPETLGEYLDLCRSFAPRSQAVAFLEAKIALDPDGRDSLVLAPDSQMRLLLMPMLLRGAS